MVAKEIVQPVQEVLPIASHAKMTATISSSWHISANVYTLALLTLIYLVISAFFADLAVITALLIPVSTAMQISTATRINAIKIAILQDCNMMEVYLKAKEYVFCAPMAVILV